MSARTLRASPHRIIEARRNTQAADDRGFWLSMLAIWAAFIVVPVLLLVASNSIARAFDRPAECEHLSAYECTAVLQEAR